MRYWNSNEIASIVLAEMKLPDERLSKDLESLRDLIIDFSVDLVALHNFQMERENINANAEVGKCLGHYLTSIAGWFIDNTLEFAVDLFLQKDFSEILANVLETSKIDET